MGATIKKTNPIFFNNSFDKKRLKRLISWVFKKSGEAEALKVLDLLKKTGFQYATQAGISIGLHDLTTPLQKSWLISESQLAMNTTDRDFIGAKITATERSQRIIDTWHRASESLSKQVVDYFGIYDQFNPVYIMALSGARGNFSQVRQLIGMRGLMADQQGKIVNFPIRSNLREGLTLTEYFISCSGARKGLVDTALRTADTGYLTRRLVDVSHHVVVKRIRCNTNRGIAFKSLQSYNKVLLALKERLVGRVLAEDVEMPFYENEAQGILSCLSERAGGFATKQEKKKDNNLSVAYTNEKRVVKNALLLPVPDTVAPVRNTGKIGEARQRQSSKLIAKKDQEISPKLSLKISQVRDKVFIRSPLTCGFTHSVCQLCYGWSISQGSLVALGDAVGVIAAQSIGEPGTQLTMRTFHTGGVFSGDLLQEIRAPHAGEIRFSKAFQGLLIRSAHGRIAFLSKTQGSLVLTNNDHFLVAKSPTLPPLRDKSQVSTKHSSATVKKSNNFTEIPIQAFTMLFVRQGEKVEKNQLLAEFSIQKKEGNQPIKTQQTIFANISGRVIEDSSGTVYTKSIKESALLLDPFLGGSLCGFTTKCAICPCPSSDSSFLPSTGARTRATAGFCSTKAYACSLREQPRRVAPVGSTRRENVPFCRVGARQGQGQGTPSFYKSFCTTYNFLPRMEHGKAPFCFCGQKRLSNLKRFWYITHLSADGTKIKQSTNKNNTILHQGVRKRSCHLPRSFAENKFSAKLSKYKFSNCLIAKPGNTRMGFAEAFVNLAGRGIRPNAPFCPVGAQLAPYGARRRLARLTKRSFVCHLPLRAKRIRTPYGSNPQGELGCKYDARRKAQGTQEEARVTPLGTPERGKRGSCLPILASPYSPLLTKRSFVRTSCAFGTRQEGDKQAKAKEVHAIDAPLFREPVKGKKKTAKTGLKKFSDNMPNRRSYTMNQTYNVFGDGDTSPFLPCPMPDSGGQSRGIIYGGAKRGTQILPSFKKEDLENDVFKYIEPVRSGRLGFLKILSTRVGATLDYTCPIKPFDHDFIKRKKMQKNNKLCFLKNQLNYLHPEYKKETRFFLQSIAEHGDVVDEAYKIV